MLKHSILVLSLICAAAAVYAEDKPQSLVDIYNQALAHDPTLASALNANQAAQEIIQQGKALYRPVVYFNAGGNASRSDATFFGGGVPFVGGAQSFTGYQYGVEARQPLYRKQNWVQIELAQTQVSLADKQLYLTQQTLILRTTQAYFDVLLAQDKIDVLLTQKAAILSQLEQAKANFDAGTATVTDVNEAQARYDLIMAQEIAAVNDYQIAQRAVQAIIGVMPSKLATVKADIKTNALEQSMDKWLEVGAQNDLNIQIRQDASSCRNRKWNTPMPAICLRWMPSPVTPKIMQPAVIMVSATILKTAPSVCRCSCPCIKAAPPVRGSDRRCLINKKRRMMLKSRAGKWSRIRSALI